MSTSKPHKNTPSEGQLANIVGFHIARARVVTNAVFQQHLGDPLNLRPAEYSLLMLLHANDTLTPKQLSVGMGLSAPLLTALLDKVQQRGLIERVRSTVDRRSMAITLTEEGKTFTQHLADATPKMESAMEHLLTPGERAILIELLDKISTHRP